MRYRKFVQARLFQGLWVDALSVSYLVLTWPGGSADMAVWNERSPRYLKAFLRKLGRLWGELPYFWTAELQKSGAVHFNVLVRGLPYVPAFKLSDLAEASGFGRSLKVKLLRRSGVRGLRFEVEGAAVSYVTKAVNYVTKGAPEWMSRRNLYGFSRDWCPGFEDVRRKGYPPAEGEGPIAAQAVEKGSFFLSEAEAYGAWRKQRLAGAVGGLLTP